jgi:outer membrane receptor protein involved in Fe transport
MARITRSSQAVPGRRLRGRAWLAALAVAAGCAAAPARAEGGAVGDLSFEQLGSMEVSGVSKSAERLLDAPAAVTVVTAEDIRAYGFRTLADVLNMAPGFFTYSDRAYDYVGVRGFAPIESVNSRVLLLIDGFPSNDTVFQQALLGDEAVFDLDLVERIEIIPGPSSSVYGTNAFLGVINVILKTPSQASSGAKAWVGSTGEHGGTASLSASAGEDTRYLLQVTGASLQGLDVTFAPQAGLPDGARVQGEDGENYTRAYAKIVSGNLRVSLGFSERRQDVGFGLYGDVMGADSWVRDGLEFADVHYEGALDAATDYVLRASLAEYRYNADVTDPYGGIPGFPPTLPGTLTAIGDWIDTEATATHHFSATDRLVVGTELRRDVREDMNYSNAVQGNFLDVSEGDSLASLYAQSDIDWSPQWATSVGLRDDLDTGEPNRLSPRLALLWKPTDWQVVKLLSGSAFRVPSFFEQEFQQPPLNLPNVGLQPERIRTLDLEYEAQVTPVTSAALTLFHYRALDLINEVPVNDVGTLQYQNSDTAQARGVDIALDSHLLPTLHARLNAEYVYAYDSVGNWEQNSPLWTGRLGLDQALPAGWRVGAEGRFESRRENFDGSTLPAVEIANLSISSTPHAGRPDFSFGVYNVFDRSYAQPVAGWVSESVNQPGRTWRATAGYRF